MKQKSLKRFASLLLSVMVFMVFSMASAMEVNAAGTKTVYVISKSETVSTSTSTIDGETKTEKNTHTGKHYYNKYGLQTKSVYNDRYTRYSRDKKGYITGYDNYDKKGNKIGATVITRKSNGDISKAKSEEYNSDGKTVYSSTTTFKYWSKGVIKKRSQKGDGLNRTSYYDKKGNLTKEVLDNGDVIEYSRTFYKSGKAKGMPKKETASYSGNDSIKKCVTNNTYDFNKKGRISKQLQKSTCTYKDGSTSQSTYTLQYTYDKRGNTTKTIETSKNEGYSSKFVTTTTYKKISVPKKYWHLFF